MSLISKVLASIASLASLGCPEDLQGTVEKRLEAIEALGIATELSQLNGPRPADGLNAADDFTPKSAFGKWLVNAPTLLDFRTAVADKESKNAVARWLHSNEDFTEQLCQALQQQTYWVSAENERGEPNLAVGGIALKSAMRVMGCRLSTLPWPAARIEMERMGTLSNWAAQEHFLIGLLVAVAIDAIRISASLRYATSNSFTAAQYREMKVALATAPDFPPFSKYAFSELSFQLWCSRNPDSLFLHKIPFQEPVEKKNKPILRTGIPEKAKFQKAFLRTLDSMEQYFRALQSGQSEAVAFESLAQIQKRSALLRDERIAAGVMRTGFSNWRRGAILRSVAQAYLELLAVKKETGAFPTAFDLKRYSPAGAKLEYSLAKGGFKIKARGLEVPFVLCYPWQLRYL